MGRLFDGVKWAAGKVAGGVRALGGPVGAALSTPEHMRKAFSVAREAHDKLHFSDEERAAAALRLGDQVVEWQRATTGQNSTRRLLALSLHFLVLGLLVAGIWVDEAWEALVWHGANDVDLFGLPICLLSMWGLVVLFYFLGTQTSQLLSRRKR